MNQLFFKLFILLLLTVYKVKGKGKAWYIVDKHFLSTDITMLTDTAKNLTFRMLLSYVSSLDKDLKLLEEKIDVHKELLQTATEEYDDKNNPFYGYIFQEIYSKHYFSITSEFLESQMKSFCVSWIAKHEIEKYHGYLSKTRKEEKLIKMINLDLELLKIDIHDYPLNDVEVAKMIEEFRETRKSLEESIEHKEEEKKWYETENEFSVTDSEAANKCMEHLGLRLLFSYASTLDNQTFTPHKMSLRIKLVVEIFEEFVKQYKEKLPEDVKIDEEIHYFYNKLRNYSVYYLTLHDILKNNGYLSVAQQLKLHNTAKVVESMLLEMNFNKKDKAEQIVELFRLERINLGKKQPAQTSENVWDKEAEEFSITTNEEVNEITKSLGFRMLASYESSNEDLSKEMLKQKKSEHKKFLIKTFKKFKMKFNYLDADIFTSTARSLFQGSNIFNEGIETYSVRKYVDVEIRNYHSYLNEDKKIVRISETIKLETQLLKTNFNKYPKSIREAKLFLEEYKKQRKNLEKKKYEALEKPWFQINKNEFEFLNDAFINENLKKWSFQFIYSYASSLEKLDNKKINLRKILIKDIFKNAAAQIEEKQEKSVPEQNFFTYWFTKYDVKRNHTNLSDEKREIITRNEMKIETKLAEITKDLTSQTFRKKTKTKKGALKLVEQFVQQRKAVENELVKVTATSSSATESSEETEKENNTKRSEKEDEPISSTSNKQTAEPEKPETSSHLPQTSNKNKKMSEKRKRMHENRVTQRQALTECEKVLESKKDTYITNLRKNFEKKKTHEQHEINLKTQFAEKQLPAFIKEKCKSVKDVEQMKQNLVFKNLLLELKEKLVKKVDGQILNHHEGEKQNPSNFKLKTELRDYLHRFIKKLPNYSESVLHIIGSSQNGFGSNNSDLDLSLITIDNIQQTDVDDEDNISSLPSMDKIYQTKTRQQILLSFLYNEFKETTIFKSYELIPSLRVPIIKMELNLFPNISVDLGVDTAVGVRNTHLLLLYSQYDDRVATLASVIKSWAKFNNIKNAREKSLSSYSWILMLIHYLQSGIKPAVLPFLQDDFPEKFGANVKDPLFFVKKKPGVPKQLCNASKVHSLTDLLLGFFRYYCFQFNFLTEWIIVTRKSVWDTKTTMHGSAIYIEEPFEHLNTADSVLYGELYFEILKKLRKGFEELYVNMDLNSFLVQSQTSQ